MICSFVDEAQVAYAPLARPASASAGQGIGVAMGPAKAEKTGQALTCQSGAGEYRLSVEVGLYWQAGPGGRMLLGLRPRMSKS